MTMFPNTLLVALAVVSIAYAQDDLPADFDIDKLKDSLPEGMDMMQMGRDGAMTNMMNQKMGGGPPKARARKGDTKYIACAVCTEAVKQFYRQTESQKKASKKKLDEDDIGEISEQVCDPTTTVGSWLKETRIKVKGDAMELVPDWDKEKCGEDCETIAHACMETYGDYSLDLAESFFRGVKRAKLTAQACNDLSDACTRKPPKVPANDPRRIAAKKKSQKPKKSKNSEASKRKEL
eukprot:m.11501 g.11501  ORF g.11501 m.11501 type:complete len:236 (+) comp4460_c0_seq1:223-930(+)